MAGNRVDSTACNNVVPNPSYDLFFKNESQYGLTHSFHRTEFTNVTNAPESTLIWTHKPGESLCISGLNCGSSLAKTRSTLHHWFVVSDSAIALAPCSYSAPSDGSSTAFGITAGCSDGECTAYDVCTPFYYCRGTPDYSHMISPSMRASQRSSI